MEVRRVATEKQRPAGFSSKIGPNMSRFLERRSVHQWPPCRCRCSHFRVRTLLPCLKKNMLSRLVSTVRRSDSLPTLSTVHAFALAASSPASASAATAVPLAATASMAVGAKIVKPHTRCSCNSCSQVAPHRCAGTNFPASRFDHVGTATATATGSSSATACSACHAGARKCVCGDSHSAAPLARRRLRQQESLHADPTRRHAVACRCGVCSKRESGATNW